MEYIFNPLTTISCFLLAIFVFRKKNTSIYKCFYLSLMGIYDPFQMRKHFKAQGIVMLIIGYVTGIVWFLL